MNLLIVDDEMLEVTVIEKMIDRHKLGIDEIYKAYSMEQAVKVFSSYNVDILLSDVEMPKGSGHKLVKWVRVQEKPVVVIFLTSHAVFHYAKEAITLGVTDYLLKPVEKDVLETALAAAVKKAKPFQEKQTPKMIRQLKAYIVNHIDREITRKELAEQIYVHPDYLSHVFKEKTGMSVSDYITNVRIDHAKTLLLTTEDSISEIASKSGYADTTYFGRVFKKQTTMTPKEYRKTGNRR